jgi:hypothetical protein
MPPVLLALGVGLSIALAPPAFAAPGGKRSAAAVPQKASVALQGEWRVLGPASQAHMAQMIRLTVAKQAPTAATFGAARLNAEQVEQVNLGRARVLREPNSEAVQALLADWQQLDSARATIDEKKLLVRFSNTSTTINYTVTAEEGIRVTTQAVSEDGAEEMLFTLVDENTLMFGPMGAEPTVLYRVGAP